MYRSLEHIESNPPSKSNCAISLPERNGPARNLNKSKLRKGLSKQRNYFALLGIFHFVNLLGNITRMGNLAPSCSSREGGKGLEIAVSNGRFDPKLQPPENRLQSPPSHRHRRPPEWPRNFREKLSVDKRPRPSRRADWFGLKMPAELPIDVERRASFLIFTL